MKRPGGRSAIGAVALCMVLCVAALGSPSAFAAIVEEIDRLPVSVTDAFDRPVTHDLVVSIVRDTTVPHAPVLILSHGRGPDRLTMGRARFPLASRFFVGLGYLVVMPTRIGCGESGGPDVETRGAGCQDAQFDHGFAVAADETQQVLDWVSKRDDVDASRIVAVGQSYGGATTLALAARNPPGLVAAINFSGGSGGDREHRPTRPCRPDRVASVYEGYGATTRVPELWLYSENDPLWGDTIPKDWFERFERGAAPAEFVEMPPVGTNGHDLFTRGGASWQAVVRRFLARHAGGTGP